MATVFTVAIGFTVIVNVIGVPVQPFTLLVNVGVTVIVAVIGAVPVLFAINDRILPVPFAAKPIDVVLFTQLYTILLPAPPLLGLVNVIVFDEVALHNT